MLQRKLTEAEALFIYDEDPYMLEYKMKNINEKIEEIESAVHNFISATHVRNYRFKYHLKQLYSRL